MEVVQTLQDLTENSRYVDLVELASFHQIKSRASTQILHQDPQLRTLGTWPTSITLINYGLQKSTSKKNQLALFLSYSTAVHTTRHMIRLLAHMTRSHDSLWTRLLTHMTRSHDLSARYMTRFLAHMTRFLAHMIRLLAHMTYSLACSP